MASHLQFIYSGYLLQILITSPSYPTPALFDDASCSITLEMICYTLKQMPTKKTLGVDNIYQEMLQLLQDQTISLIKVFRKLLERHLHPLIAIQIPILDLAQDGFREARGLLDQELCLAKIYNIFRRYYHISPALAFLDIKSAYDTVAHYVI
ncbi:hypothetical protein G6F43_011911 [Rhizopus delemar]|nr:hypothetical protein G6F43_011911 [Rhizopus delemar]